jgi:hypothetical protein
MLCLLLDGRRRREGKKKKKGGVFPGLNLPCWLCCGSQMLGIAKG